jgi:hypothetical protein
MTMGSGALARFPALWNHAAYENARQGKIPGLVLLWGLPVFRANFHQIRRGRRAPRIFSLTTKE